MEQLPRPFSQILFFNLRELTFLNKNSSIFKNSRGIAIRATQPSEPLQRNYSKAWRGRHARLIKSHSFIDVYSFNIGVILSNSFNVLYRAV